MPVPSGSFDFAFPRVTRDNRGGLHLVWAELADTTGSISAWGRPPIALWHSTFSNGRWSAPQNLLSARSVSWSSDGRPIVSDSAGRIHVVVPVALADHLAVIYLRIDPSGVVEQKEFSAGAGYASITYLGGDSLLIALSTSDPLTPRGGSSILYRVSSDGGRSWTDPAVIARRSQRNASSPLVERTRTGLAAFWVEDPRTAGGMQTMRGFSARSTNDVWTEISPAYAIDGMAFHFASAGTACGVHAVILEILRGPSSNPTMHLVDVAARDGRLTATELFPDLVTAASMGVGADRNRIRLMFSAVKANAQRAIPATAVGRACQTM